MKGEEAKARVMRERPEKTGLSWKPGKKKRRKTSTGLCVVAPTELNPWVGKQVPALWDLQQGMGAATTMVGRE